MNSRFTLLAIINFLCFTAVIVVNYLSNSLPLNGKTPGELSDQYPNLFVPTGLTFAIWGIIYIFLLGWVLGQMLGLFSPRQRERCTANVENTGWLFALTCALNVGWLFAWHWEHIGLSIIVMITMLATLITLNEKIGNGRAATNAYEKWLAYPAFGLYQGWITVALIANVTAFLVASGWTGFGIAESIWAILMILVGAGVAVYMVLSRNMIFHGIAVAWALLGIYLKRNAADDAVSVEYIALISMAAVLIAAGLRLRRYIQ